MYELENVRSKNTKSKFSFSEQIRIFFKPSRQLWLMFKNFLKKENGSVTLETALVMPVIVLCLCLILFSVNISINYLRIQDTAHTCAQLVNVNKSHSKCLKLNSDMNGSTSKVNIFDKNDMIEVSVEKKISLFPNLPTINLKTSSVVYKTAQGNNG